MSYELRLPNITSSTAEGQLTQLQSYVYQLVQELNFALNSIEKAEAGDMSSVVINASTGGTKSPEEAQETFASIKSLIIKSADIVEAYGDKIDTMLSSRYVAESRFGKFEEDIKQYKTETAANETRRWEIQQQLNDIVVNTNAYIKTGILEDNTDGSKVIGVEVGQTNEGTNTFSRFARFCDDGVHLYDRNSNEIATFANDRMVINNAVIKTSAKIGGYQLDLSSGIKFKWVGR